MTAYALGMIAFRNGISLGDNPYSVDTDLFYEWEDGWYDASEGGV